MDALKYLPGNQQWIFRLTHMSLVVLEKHLYLICIMFSIDRCGVPRKCYVFTIIHQLFHTVPYSNKGIR